MGSFICQPENVELQFYFVMNYTGRIKMIERTISTLKHDINEVSLIN